MAVPIDAPKRQQTFLVRPPGIPADQDFSGGTIFLAFNPDESKTIWRVVLEQGAVLGHGPPAIAVVYLIEYAYDRAPNQPSGLRIATN